MAVVALAALAGAYIIPQNVKNTPETAYAFPVLTVKEISKSEELCSKNGGVKGIDRDFCIGHSCGRSDLPWAVTCGNGYRILMEKDQSRP